MRIYLKLLLIYVLCILFWSIGCEGAEVITHSTGTTTYTTPSNISSCDSAGVYGGDASFQNTFKSGSGLDLIGGTATILGTFSGNITATGGTLLIGSSADIKNQTTLTMGNTFMDIGDHNINISSMTLTGDSTISLSGTNSSIDFGTIIDSNYDLNITNWDASKSITFDAPMFSNMNMFINGSPALYTLQGARYTATPLVPETSTQLIMIFMCAGGVLHFIKEKSKIKKRIGSLKVQY
jgi:hypothetical protein